VLEKREDEQLYTQKDLFSPEAAEGSDWWKLTMRLIIEDGK
jgi:hypothetical protein